MKPPSTKARRRAWRSIAILFVLASLIWIVLWDFLLTFSGSDPALLGAAGSRWLVLLVGGGLLYWYGGHLDRVAGAPEQTPSGTCLPSHCLRDLDRSLSDLMILFDADWRPLDIFGGCSLQVPRDQVVESLIACLRSQTASEPQPGTWDLTVQGRILEITLSAVDPAALPPARRLCIVRDATTLRAEALERRRVQEQLEAIVEASPFALMVGDEEGRVLYWNSQATRIFGWTAEEVLGSIPPFVPPDKLDEFQEFIRSAAAGNRLANIPRLRRRKDGSLLTLRAHAVPLWSAGDKAPQILAIVEDLTEATGWQTQGRKYELLARHTPDKMLFMDAAGQILDANPASLAAYGFSLEELQSMNIRDLRSPETLELKGKQLAQLDEGPVRFETVHRRKDGSVFPVEVSSVRADLDGTPMVLSLIRDITARKRRSFLSGLLSQLDHAVLRGGDLSAALEDLCQTMAREWDAERVTVELTSSDSADHQNDSPSPNSGTALCLPLIAQGTQVGTLEILAATGSLAAQYDYGALAEFARQLGATLVTARHQERLRLMESALESVVNAITITDAQGVIQWVNPAFTALTGYRLDEVRGENPRILKSGLHSPRFYESLWNTLTQGQVWRGEMKNRRKDGTLYDEEMTITPLKDPDGTIRHFIAIKQDVTRRKLDEERIQHLSTTDALTGLANRRSLEQRLSALASLANPRFTSMLFVLDIDQFKAINDSFGIEVGDQLLVAVAQALKTTVRDRGAVARLGDDEYAILLPNVARRDAHNLVHALVEAVEGIRIHQGDRVIEPTVSIGVAQIDGTKSGYELLNEAERALLTAKSRGSGRVEFFSRADDPHHQISGALVEWAARIRHGVRNDRFVLYFQPVVHLKTGRVEHAEALVRLRDPNGAIILPGHFIAIAETLHLMPVIDRWVIDQVIDRMREDHDLRIFVNLSAQSLGDGELREHVSRMLLLHPHVAHRLTFEVTETSALRHFAGVREWMELLRSLGCRFALDDFGSGFSSFAYLRELPVDYVKLDGSFVRAIESDPSSLAVVRALVDVSHTMGKTVIAEWVENDRIAQLLGGLGVEYGQGFALGRPGTSLDFSAIPPLKIASS